MKAIAPGPHVFEFSFPKKDTLLKVEVWEDAVTIRATRNTFSPPRRAAFVRELIAEGFIAPDYCYGAAPGAGRRGASSSGSWTRRGGSWTRRWPRGRGATR